ncbi:MAG: TetR/AcrR family transcriptional regulator [Treponema sp.]|jgi:AcrR family transcriptional regulator|nr:TetR/AcrR family transcriptional regulator [Treponema sp.]
MEPKKRGLTGDAVLAAAVKIVETRGFSQLTIQELASSLNVKPASLYNHIGGIDEAKLRLACYALEKMEAALRDTAVGYSREEALKKIAYAYRRFGSAHPELYRAFINCADIEDKKMGEAKQSVVRIFHQVLEPYSLEYETKVHFTRCFRSSLHGFVSFENERFFKNTVDVEASFNMLIESQLALLRTYA